MHRTPRARLAAVLAFAAAAIAGLTGCTSSDVRHTGPAALRLTTPPPPRGPHPNIVFVLADDLSTNLMPYMPHVRALAAEGAAFRNYFVVDSLCCPSRAAIFTGQYPHDDGVFTNIGRDGGYHTYNRVGDPAKSFAMGLHAAGYRTAFMGKYLNRYWVGDAPAPGWDIWDVAGDGYPEFNYWLNENGTRHWYGSAPRDYLTDVLGGKAADFIASTPQTGRPFALEVATFTPHAPSTPAPRDARSFPRVRAPRGPAFDRKPAHAPSWFDRVPPLSARDESQVDAAFRLRVRAVQAIDRLVAHLEQVLAKTNQLHNTYFVFSSDNGYHMGEYQLLPGKQTAFDTDIRVPLVVAGPGVPHGEQVTALTSSIDLAPTFLAMARARATDRPDGVSLLDLLHGKPPGPGWQRAILVEHHGPSHGVTDPDLQRLRSGHPPSYEAMRTARYLYVEYKGGAREYYDLTKDPHELDNLAGSLSSARVAALHAALRRLAECHGAADCQQAASAGSVLG